MLPTITFIITSALGLISTVVILRNAQAKGQLSHHLHALILASGLGITIMLSFFLPLMAAGIRPSALVGMSGILHSILWFFLAYTSDRLFLKLRKM
jgi:hypothetical protein